MPLLGSRRRSYLLLSALAAAVLWLAMGLVHNHYHWLLLLVLLMNTAIVFGSATSGGLLVEAGQKFGASGRLSSLRVFAQTAGNGAGLWLGGLLAGYALGVTSAAALVPLAGMFLVTWWLQREPRAPARVLPANGAARTPLAVVQSVGRQIRNVMRREMLLPAVLLFFLQAVPTFRSTCFYQYQTETLKYTDAAFGLLQSVGCAVSLLSTGIYAWWCRRVSLRLSLHAAIVMTSLSALPYLFYASYPEHLHRALVIEGLGTFLQYAAYLPLMDMAVRSTPKGSEALGYSLLISVWNIGLMLGTKLGPMLYDRLFDRHMNSLIWLNAGVTLAGIFLVLLLPAKVVAQREGG